MSDITIHIAPYRGGWCLWRFGAGAPFAYFDSRREALRAVDETPFRSLIRFALQDDTGEIERIWWVGKRRDAPAESVSQYELHRPEAPVFDRAAASNPAAPRGAWSKRAA